MTQKNEELVQKLNDMQRNDAIEKSKLETLEKKNRELETKTCDLQGQIEKLKHQISGLEMEKTQLIEKIRALEKKFSDAEVTNSQLQTRVLRLEEQQKAAKRENRLRTRNTDLALNSFNANHLTLVLGQVATEVEKELLRLAKIERNTSIFSVLHRGDNEEEKQQLESVLEEQTFSQALQLRVKELKLTRNPVAHPDISPFSKKKLKQIARDINVEDLAYVDRIIDFWARLKGSDFQ